MKTQWHHPNWPAPKPSAALRARLLDPTSLTRRLTAECGHFSVRLLAQRRQRPYRDEVVLLGLRRGEWALVRRVLLLCDGEPVVYARTVIPPKSLSGPRRRLLHLGSRSLGGVLFASHSLHRTELQLTRLHPGQPLHREATAAAGDRAAPVWGRRSCFTLHGASLLVSEFFLRGEAD